MLAWIVRLFMFIASIITCWFVARDTASLDVIEMVVSLLLIIVFLALGASWPYLVAWFADRRACAGRVPRPAPGMSRLNPLGWRHPLQCETDNRSAMTLMNTGYLTAITALAGSAIGALASLGTTWLNQHAQERAHRLAEITAHQLYEEFMHEASRLYADSLTHDLGNDVSKLVD
jgi:hypothetical protein